MKKQRRHWVTFTFHLDLFCKPNQENRIHDKLHILLAQTVANHTGEFITLRDCKTGQFKGSVSPRR